MRRMGLPGVLALGVLTSVLAMAAPAQPRVHDGHGPGGQPPVVPVDPIPLPFPPCILVLGAPVICFGAI